MNLTVILGAMAIVGAISLFWWGVTARPSAARANLFAGLPQPRRPASGPPSLAGWETPLAAFCRVRLWTGSKSSSSRQDTRTGSTCPASSGSRSRSPSWQRSCWSSSACRSLPSVAAAVLFFLPDYWVMTRRDKRQADMQAKAADIIDQLTICVEAGLGFDAALARVATTTEGPLTEELRHTISDIQAGVPRAQALRTLADRAQIVEIRQVVTALLQAQKHGVPMAETLRVLSTEMRLKRKQRTEEKAAKLTVKMLFPIVFCFLPVFMIITVVPSLLNLGDAF